MIEIFAFIYSDDSFLSSSYSKIENSYIGDGECDKDPAYFREECGFDGGDCDE